MFGLPLAEHDARYDYLDEWVSVLETLVAGRRSSIFEGKFLKAQDRFRCHNRSTAASRSCMTAGVFEPRSTLRVCQHADFCFVAPGIGKRGVQSYNKRQMAREIRPAKLGVGRRWPIVQRDTVGGGSFSELLRVEATEDRKV